MTDELITSALPLGSEHLANRARDCGMSRVRFDSQTFLRPGGGWIRIPRLVIGDRTCTDMGQRRKYVCFREWDVTINEVVRAYLRWIHETQRGGPVKSMAFKRVPWRREQFALLDHPQPLYFGGEIIRGELAYVDIKSCYFQLYSPATLDLHFDPGLELLGVGRIEWLDSVMLGSSKQMRNALIGACRAQHVRVAEYGKLKVTRSYNRFLAPQLWGYMMWTLHSVMAEAIELFQPYYIHTDGLIVDPEKAQPLIDWLADAWQLEASVKAQGVGRVWSIGGFSIAGNNARQAKDRGRVTNNLMQIDPAMRRKLRGWRGWLLDRPRPKGDER